MSTRSFFLASTLALLLMGHVYAITISEFMASNDGAVLMDVDGEASDWIEIHNDSDNEVSLQGFSLTNERESPQEWRFPELTLAPNAYLVVFASGKDRVEPSAQLHTNFRLARGGEYLALTDAFGTVVQSFDPEYPHQQPGIAYGWIEAAETFTALARPTPGEPNASSTPRIVEIDYFPKPASPDEDLVVTARVEALGNTIDSVTLRSRVMFRGEAATEMVDTGEFPDETANDGVYSARIARKTLFAALFKPGVLVRWNVEVIDGSGTSTRWPTFATAECEEYVGTIIDTGQIETRLQVLHRFVEDESDAETRGGTRGAVYFNGELYDNVFQRIRGGTAVSWPKKSFKLEFPEDHHFRFDPELPRVDEFNLNATYTDKSYTRAIMTAELHQDAGGPAPITFPMRVHSNGEFYSVALFVEQCDRDYLRRNDLDPDGSYYKAGPGSTYTSTGSFEKKTRKDEGKEDLTEFLAGLKLKGDDLEAFLFDSVDIPAQINFMASVAVTQNIDDSDKNHFLYRDTEGSGEWFMTPWDLDLTFGPDALNTDFIIADDNGAGASNPKASHPFIGSRAFPLHSGKTNELLDRMFVNTRTKRMFLRRLRTMSDQFLFTDYFDKRLDELVNMLAVDVPLDRETWGTRAHFGGRRDSMEETVERIKTEYLVPRRAYFERGGSVDIPNSQAAMAPMKIAEVEVSPVSGNQDEEYLLLTNPNAYTVDLSGWRLEGGIEHDFSPGTALPAGSLFSPGINQLFVVKSARAFRARSDGPSGGQGLFVQGDFRGNLSNRGETIRLVDDQGNVIVEEVLQPSLTDVQARLKISEFLTAHAENPDVEFIELVNVGETALDLTGVRFTQGVEFDFTHAPETILAPGARVLLVYDRGAFESVYGSGLAVLGEFDRGRLDNNGELLKLEDAMNNTVAEIRYDTQIPWPDASSGRSLVLTDLAAGSHAENASAWGLSMSVGGDPGVADEPLPPTPMPTDFSAAIDIQLADDDESFLITFPRYEGVSALEFSRDLKSWQPMDAQFTYDGTKDTREQYQLRPTGQGAMYVRVVIKR